MSKPPPALLASQKKPAICVTSNLLDGLFCYNIFNLNMKGSSILVVSVTNSLHNRVILQFIFSLYMKA